jgi:hypothetical protein
VGRLGLVLSLLTSAFSSSFPLPALLTFVVTRNNELSRFIANSHLHASIDKVPGIVETTRPSLKNAQYKTVVKRGDVQRLSKVLY